MDPTWAHIGSQLHPTQAQVGSQLGPQGPATLALDPDPNELSDHIRGPLHRTQGENMHPRCDLKVLSVQIALLTQGNSRQLRRDQGSLNEDFKLVKFEQRSPL